MPLFRISVKKIFLLFLAVFVLFLFVEIGVRFFRPQITTQQAILSSPSVFRSSDYLPWQLQPNSFDYQASPYGEYNVSIRVNSYGLRDDERPLSSEHMKRILFVGDSFTFGHGVEETDRYTEFLEREFFANNLSYEVFNAGYASGYSPDTYVAYTLREGLSFSPTTVVVGFYIGNDFLDLFKNDVIQRKGTQQIVSDFYFVDDSHRLRRSRYGLENPLVLFLTRYSHALVLLRDRLEQRLNPILPETELYMSTYDASLDEKWQTIQQIFSGLQTTLSQQNISLSIVIIPSAFQLSDSRWNAYAQTSDQPLDRTKPQRLLLAFCREHNLSCIDLYDDLKSYTSQHEIYYPRDGHWTAEGHRFVGELLFKKLSSIL